MYELIHTTALIVFVFDRYLAYINKSDIIYILIQKWIYSN